jgi:hypothetical protein
MNTRKKIALSSILIAVIAVVGYLVWTCVNQLDYLAKTAHETTRWAVIRDSRGNIIAIEPTENEVWSVLRSLLQNQTAMWIGGIVENYDNHWEFRFKPDTIVVAHFTVEGGQSNIQGISEDLNYWTNTWARETYVLARVAEMYE